MTIYTLPKQPPIYSHVTDKDGDVYVLLMHPKGFPRWYSCDGQHPHVMSGREYETRPNWRWPELLNAFGPLTLVPLGEMLMLDQLYGSAPSSSKERLYCLTCGLLVWDTDLHTAWHKPEVMKTAAG